MEVRAQKESQEELSGTKNQRKQRKHHKTTNNKERDWGWDTKCGPCFFGENGRPGTFSQKHGLYPLRCKGVQVVFKCAGVFRWCSSVLGF